MREELFWAKVNMLGDCWVWTGRSGNQFGHGKFSWRENGKIRGKTAHRLAYELSHGVTLPDDVVVDHAVCDNPRCVNPAHLEPKSQRENVLRSSGPSAENARKTHCTHGHEFIGSNILIRKGRYGPERQCRKCNAEKQARWRARQAV
jgi:hypothetical protein